MVANGRVRHKHQMLQELQVIKWDKETWILATRYLAPVCIVANNWNQMKFVVLCQTNRQRNEWKPINNWHFQYLLSCFTRFSILDTFNSKDIWSPFEHTFFLSPYLCNAVLVVTMLFFPSFKINLLILISLIVQTVGPASARLAPANIVEWNGDVCVRNKITTFAAPIYLLKCTISGVTEKEPVETKWLESKDLC